jgi:hypothetical protein
MQYCLRVSLLVDHVSHNLCRKYGVDVSVRLVVVQARFEFTDSRHSFRAPSLFQANQRLLPRRRPKQVIFSCFGQHRPRFCFRPHTVYIVHAARLVSGGSYCTQHVAEVARRENLERRRRQRRFCSP